MKCRDGEQINSLWVLGMGVVNRTMKCYSDGTLKYLGYGSGCTKLYV